MYFFEDDCINNSNHKISIEALLSILEIKYTDHLYKHNCRPKSEYSLEKCQLYINDAILFFNSKIIVFLLMFDVIYFNI